MLFQINNLGGDFLNPTFQNISSILFKNLSFASLRPIVEMIVFIVNKDQLKSYSNFSAACCLSKEKCPIL